MTAMEKIEAETRERIMKLVRNKTEDVARCHSLDLQKAGDLVLAYSKIFNNDRGLYDLSPREQCACDKNFTD